jgi:hypothetical protein
MFLGRASSSGAYLGPRNVVSDSNVPHDPLTPRASALWVPKQLRCHPWRSEPDLQRGLRLRREADRRERTVFDNGLSDDEISEIGRPPDDRARDRRLFTYGESTLRRGDAARLPTRRDPGLLTS